MSPTDRLLRTLDEAIQHSRITRELPFLRAERSVVLARLGELEHARKEVSALRALPHTDGNGVLHAWLWLAEGLIDYHENFSERARDRVHRSLALARSVRAPRIQALAAAWLAHIEFRVQSDTSAIEHVKLALQLAAPDHHGARTRACILVAGIYQFVGNDSLALPWYAQARMHATREGDGASLSAMAYNMAMFRVMNVRLSALFGGHDSLAAKRARLGTESSMFLDQSLRNRALNHHPPMQQAQILVVHREFAAALALYDKHLADAMAQGLSSSQCLYEADRAWCLLELGRSDEALAAARTADSAFIGATELEEQTVAHGVLAQVYSRLGLAELGDRHAQLATDTYRQLRQRWTQLNALLSAAELEAVPGALTQLAA
jgi:tetratricopeptide (TPR) repeat protein